MENEEKRIDTKTTVACPKCNAANSIDLHETMVVCTSCHKIIRLNEDGQWYITEEKYLVED